MEQPPGQPGGFIVKFEVMLLKELSVGRRFVFEDQKTHLVLTGSGTTYPPTGGFMFLGVVNGDFPKLRHIETGTTIVLMPGTLQRSVLVLL